MEGRGGTERGGRGRGQGNPRQLIFIIHPPPLQKKLGAFAKFRKITISFIMSVCPSLPKEQLDSHLKAFHEI